MRITLSRHELQDSSELIPRSCEQFICNNTSKSYEWGLSDWGIVCQRRIPWSRKQVMQYIKYVHTRFVRSSAKILLTYSISAHFPESEIHADFRCKAHQSTWRHFHHFVLKGHGKTLLQNRAPGNMLDQIFVCSAFRWKLWCRSISFFPSEEVILSPDEDQSELFWRFHPSTEEHMTESLVFLTTWWRINGLTSESRDLSVFLKSFIQGYAVQGESSKSSVYIWLLYSKASTDIRIERFVGVHLTTLLQSNALKFESTESSACLVAEFQSQTQTTDSRDMSLCQAAVLQSDRFKRKNCSGTWRSLIRTMLRIHALVCFQPVQWFALLTLIQAVLLNPYLIESFLKIISAIAVYLLEKASKKSFGRVICFAVYVGYAHYCLMFGHLLYAFSLFAFRALEIEPRNIAVLLNYALVVEEWSESSSVSSSWCYLSKMVTHYRRRHGQIILWNWSILLWFFGFSVHSLHHLSLPPWQWFFGLQLVKSLSQVHSD